MAPRDGFEPSTQRLTAACSTTELPGIRAGTQRRGAASARWRPEAESNRCTRICGLSEAISREFPKWLFGLDFNPLEARTSPAGFPADPDFSRHDYTGITHAVPGRGAIGRADIGQGAAAPQAGSAFPGCPRWR